MDFQATYDRSAYLRWFGTSFLPDDFLAKTESISFSFNTKFIQKAILLGKSESLDLPVYEIHHHSENDPRVSLAKETFHLLAEYLVRNALVIFVSSNSENYRLSYISIDLKIVDGKIQKDFTNPRRHSFFLGPNCKTHTPSEFLLKKGRIKSLEDLQERFSVEVVNKAFYNEIAILFTRLVGGSRKIGSKTVEEKGLLQLPSLPNNEQNHQKYQEFAVRLLGRLVFCWFLKKKSSPSGVPLISEDLLSSQAVGENEHYYHNILEHLFFQVLNTPQDERNEVVRDRFKDTPFLNGGLFEPHEDDYYYPDPVMGITRYLNNLNIKDEWFLDLFTIFETYNFTIDENTTIDIELSIDPEMLGRIFENLLAEINPETGETARKSTGSYYTPRPIVEYMVDESLKHYLQRKTGLNSSVLNHLLSYSEDVQIDGDDRAKIIKALDEIRVLDLACGSGAFPMGVLQKLLLILQKIDPDASEWQRRTLNSIPDPTVRELISNKLKNDHDLWDYSRKLGIIRKSIYGIDIQAIAIEISKLRIFLSLFVDEKVDDDKINRGIEHLPNLEFKFVSANSLVGLPKDRNISVGESQQKIEKLKILRDAYFASYGSQKRKIENEFRQVQKEMANDAICWGKTDTLTYKLTSWEPFSYTSADFFDSEWMFGNKTGFDIVIGNPPYFSIATIEKSYSKYLSECYKPIHTGYNDIVYYFIYLAIELMTREGCTVLITSNYYLGNEYAKKLRAYLGQFILKCINFRDYMIFNAASVHTCISFFSKEPRNNNVNFFESTSRTKFQLSNIEENLSLSVVKRNFLKESWIVADKTESTILQQIRKNEDLLGNIAIIRKGATSGDRKIFTVDKIYAQEHEFEQELLRTSINSKDIKRYMLVDSGKYLIYIDDNTIIENYPNIYRYLFKHKKKLLNRNEVLKGLYPWYRLERPREKVVFDSNEKIIVPYRAKSNMFARDNRKGFNDGGGSYAIVIKEGENIQINYLLGILNSTLMNWFYGFIGKPKGKVREYFNGPLSQIPIKLVSIEEQQPFINIVELIIIAKQLNLVKESYVLECLIDAMVYEIYLSEGIKNADAEVIKYLLHIPKIESNWSNTKKLQTIQTIVSESSIIENPLRLAIEKQRIIPEIQIIEKID